jgi:hypothetical protein
MAGLFTVKCNYFYESNSDEIRTPQVEFAKEASQFQNTFWENYDLTEQPVIAHICLRRRIYALFILLFKPSCNGPETELKYKFGIRENVPLVF